MKLSDVLGWTGLTIVLTTVVLSVGVVLVAIIMKAPLLGIPITALAIGFGMILVATALE